jgi:hypothetical protein
LLFKFTLKYVISKIEEYQVGPKLSGTYQLLIYVDDVNLFGDNIHTFMELNLPWEAANCAATQELPSILWNPNVHYHIHKIPPLIPILSQINSVHITPSYHSKMHFNIIQSPTSWSS